MVNVSEALEIENILEYSGFNNSAQWTIIKSNVFEVYDEIFTLVHSDIVNLVNCLSDSTVVAGKIIFGLLRTNLLNANIHWA